MYVFPSDARPVRSLSNSPGASSAAFEVCAAPTRTATESASSASLNPSKGAIPRSIRWCRRSGTRPSGKIPATAQGMPCALLTLAIASIAGYQSRSEPSSSGRGTSRKKQAMSATPSVRSPRHSAICSPSCSDIPVLEDQGRFRSSGLATGATSGSCARMRCAFALSGCGNSIPSSGMAATMRLLSPPETVIALSRLARGIPPMVRNLSVSTMALGVDTPTTA